MCGSLCVLGRCRNRIGPPELLVQRLDDLMARSWVDGTGANVVTLDTVAAVKSMTRIINSGRLSGTHDILTSATVTIV